MSGEIRGVPARIGIAALNLLAPGLGLLRVQRAKAAALLLLAPPALIGLLILVYAALPTIGFRTWAVLMAALLAAVVGLYVASIALSWRASRPVQAPGRWWSRWYGIVGALLAMLAAGALLQDVAFGYYKSFYTPAESMAPTLLVNDRFVASMRGPGELRRGDIIVFDVGGPIYVKRVAALAGDRIAMRDGVVVLNGRPVPQRLVRSERIESLGMLTEVRRLSEQFPGEAAPHEIYDSGDWSFDDMAERVVAPGHVFVLGDNRDHSADSRVPRAEMGVEQLPIADIRGRALFHTWGPSGRMGVPLTP